MPVHYTLKKSPFDKNRTLKLCKDAVDKFSADRSLALETYRYFKQLVEGNPNDTTSKTLMVDCLKLMQSATKNEAGLIDLISKIETNHSLEKKKDSISLFDQLENSNG
jgi:hypothetical protein